MVETLQIVSIVVTVGTAILFSGLFSSELFIWYQIIPEQFDNSTRVFVGNIGPMQAKNAVLSITSAKQPDEITENCLEGQLIPPTENQNITQIAFERMSTGLNCRIDLHGIHRDNVTDIVIISDGRSAYRPGSYGILTVYLTLVVVVVLELFSILLLIPSLLYGTLPLLLSLKYRKDQSNRSIQAKIKSEFGIKLYLIDIEILKKIHSEKKTILQLSSQLKLPSFLVKRRLRALTKIELIDEERVLNQDIIQIISSI